MNCDDSIPFSVEMKEKLQTCENPSGPQGRHDDLIRQAILIRKTEEKLLGLYEEGKLFGTVHTCIGQEWISVAAARVLREGDCLFSNHRGHGHFIAWTGNVEGLLAEVMGRAGGVCGGIGGSQHLHTDGFYSNGILGGMAPVATGRAFAEKMQQTDNISLLFSGDGALGQGVMYESLNIASKWALPLLVVVENNQIAQTTLQETTMAGSIQKRAEAFDIAFRKSNTWNWESLLDDFEFAARYVREETKPFLIEVETYRLKPHSKGDDTRPNEEVKAYGQKDPINVILVANPGKWDSIVESVEVEVDEAVARAERSDLLDFKPSTQETRELITWGKKVYAPGRIVDLLNETLKDAFREDERLIMIGEDLQSPYGGAFKVSRDMSNEFPERIVSTPISEAALVGVGSGLSLSGRIPIVEIMFGDFLGLCFDQLLNHACKFPWMYGGPVEVPLVVRTPMGGRRGYGPTHSQSIEKHFLGIPGLTVLALNIRVHPQAIYEALFQSIQTPTLVIENKVLYTRFLKIDSPVGFEVQFTRERFPTVRISPVGAPPDVTLFCYGGMLEDVEKALELAFDEHEILCEIICPAQLQPFNIQPLFDSVASTGRLLIVEEGTSFGALSAEVIAQLIENGAPLKRVERIGYDHVIPTSGDLEKRVLPSPKSILDGIMELTHGGS